MSTRAHGGGTGRRDAMMLLVGGGISATFGCAAGDRASLATGGAAALHGDSQRSPFLSCIVRPEQTEGPYFVDDGPHRSDIRVDPTDGSVRQGVPLELALGVQLIEENSCSPLVGALVDVWQCDAAGTYSDVVDRAAGFDTSGKKFLRGNLLTDGQGLARFTTIYPGCYPGRTPHIHFKIRAALESHAVHEFTSQLYFDDALTDSVYQHAPYERRTADVTNASDLLYRRGGDQLLLNVTRDGSGYRAAFGIGLRIT